MKQFSFAHAAALGALAVIAFPPASVADEYDKKTTITINEPLEVPGIVLQPGKYVFKLLNSSSNRHIVEVMNERMDHLYALSFTAAARKIQPKGKTVLSFYEGKNGQPMAVRQWFWPGDLDGQEFLYPHKQAERLSASAGVKVAEGPLPTAKESGTKLVPDNAEKAETETSAVVSSKSSDADDRRQSTTPQVTAQAAQPAPEPRPEAVNAAPPAPAPEPQVSQAPAQPAAPSAIASNRDQDNTKSLPQTASPLPLIALFGAVSLLLAFTMRAFARRSRS
jgi:hypothetical protein